MNVVVVTAPSPVVTFDEVSKHIIDVPAEDKDYVEGLVTAATAWIDGPAGWLGRSIGVQMLEYRDDHPCSPIVSLPCGPVLEVVEAWSGDDEVEVSAYQPGALAFSFDTQMIAGRPIRVRYWAGYGKRATNDPTKWINDAPAPIKVAIMMLVAQWYRTRAAAIIGDSVAVMPFAVDALLHSFRLYR